MEYTGYRARDTVIIIKSYSRRYEYVVKTDCRGEGGHVGYGVWVTCALGASRDCAEEFGTECDDARVPVFGGVGSGK